MSASVTLEKKESVLIACLRIFLGGNELERARMGRNGHLRYGVHTCYLSAVSQRIENSTFCTATHITAILLHDTPTHFLCSQASSHTRSPHSASALRVHGCCASPQRHQTHTLCTTHTVWIITRMQIQKQHRTRSENSILPFLPHHRAHLVCTRLSTMTSATPTHSLRFRSCIPS